MSNFVVSARKFTRLSLAEHVRNHSTCFFDCGYLDPFRRYRDRSLKLSEIAPNFARFLAPSFFWRGPPKFWDLGYKIEDTSHHVAKFHSREIERAGRSHVEKK